MDRICHIRKPDLPTAMSDMKGMGLSLGLIVLTERWSLVACPLNLNETYSDIVNCKLMRGSNSKQVTFIITLGKLLLTKLLLCLGC